MSVPEALARFIGPVGRDGHRVGGPRAGYRGHPARLHDARDPALLQPLPDQVGHRLVVGPFHDHVVTHVVLVAGWIQRRYRWAVGRANRAVSTTALITDRR